MTTSFSSIALGQFEHRLRDRLAQLREEARTALERRENESYAQLVGQIHHSDEEALANILVEANLSELAHLIEEVRAVNGALERVRLGTYGTCVACGQPIDALRLDAYPTAERCIGCQSEREAVENRDERQPSGLRKLDAASRRSVLG